MAIRAIAAGDSLILEAVVPAELGEIAEALIEAAAERRGPVSRRLRLTGSVVGIDPARRVVRVSWPIGQLSAGVWRVQIRATTISRISTFVLDEEIAVELSLLPPRTQVSIARIGLPRLEIAATGHGAVARAAAVLRLPRLSLSARGGRDAPAVATVRLRKLGVLVEGLGAIVSGAATLQLPRLGMTAAGPGAVARATVVLRLPRMRLRAEGNGDSRVVVTARLPRLGVVAQGPGAVASGTATLRLPRLGLRASGTALAPGVAGPGIPQFFFGPGSAPGEVGLSVVAPPESLGDGPAFEDGAGELTGLVIRIGSAPPVTYDATIPRMVEAGGFTPGADVSATVQALGYGGRPGAIGFAVTQAAAEPSAPSTPEATAGPGEAPGEVDLSILDAPELWGDAVIAGDGGGVLTAYRSRINGVLAEHNTTALPINRTATGLTEGVQVLVEAWSLGSEGRPGAIWSTFVYPAVTAPAGSIGLVDQSSGKGLVDQISGRGIVIPAPAED